MELRELLRILEVENFPECSDQSKVTIDDERALELYEEMKNAIRYVFEYYPPDEHLKMYYIKQDKKTSDDKQQQKHFDLKYRVKQLESILSTKENELIRCQTRLSTKESEYEEYLKIYDQKKEELLQRTDAWSAEKNALAENVKWLSGKEKEYEENKNVYTTAKLQELNLLIEQNRERFEKRGEELKQTHEDILNQAYCLDDEKQGKIEMVEMFKILLEESKKNFEELKEKTESEKQKCEKQLSEYTEDFAKKMDSILEEKEKIRNKELKNRQDNIDFLKDYIKKCFILLCYFIAVCQTGNLSEANKMADTLVILYSRKGNMGVKYRDNMLDAKTSSNSQKNRIAQVYEYYKEVAGKYSDCVKVKKLAERLESANFQCKDYTNDTYILEICFEGDEKAIAFNRDLLDKVIVPYKNTVQYYHGVIYEKESEYETLIRSFWGVYDEYGANEVELIKYLYNLNKNKCENGLFDIKRKNKNGKSMHPNYREWDCLSKTEKCRLVALLEGLYDSNNTYFKYMTNTRFEDANCRFGELLADISGDFNYVYEIYLKHISDFSSKIHEKENKRQLSTCDVYEEYKKTMKQLYELSRRLSC